MFTCEEIKNKISESVKANWVIRIQKYGNSEGCRDPEARHRKISMSTKGRPGIKGRHAWNKGLKKETDPRLQSVSEKVSKWGRENHGKIWAIRVEKYGPSGHKKGVTSWNKGIKGKYKNPHSKECKRKISEGHLKFHRENPGKGGWSGKHLPEDMKIKLRHSSAVRLSKQPHKDTKPELALAKILNSLEIKYEQQIPIDTSIPDFFIQPNICIFVDGMYWHNRPEIKERDVRVNQALGSLGYKVIRFWDRDIYDNPQNIKNQMVGW